MQKRVMSPLLAAASLAALLAGCSRGSQEVSAPDPGSTPTASPAGGKRAACEQEIAIECPDGMSDGCGRQATDGAALTNYHVCVPAEEESSQPCEQEIARECGEGLVDACLVQPPAAASHICVQASAHP